MKIMQILPTKKNIDNGCSLYCMVVFYVISIFCTLVMLAGTTFAWLNDFVENSNNLIRTGTFNVEITDNVVLHYALNCTVTSTTDPQRNYWHIVYTVSVAPSESESYTKTAETETVQFTIKNNGRLPCFYLIEGATQSQCLEAGTTKNETVDLTVSDEGIGEFTIIVVSELNSSNL